MYTREQAVKKCRVINALHRVNEQVETLDDIHDRIEDLESNGWEIEFNPAMNLYQLTSPDFESRMEGLIEEARNNRKCTDSDERESADRDTILKLLEVVVCFGGLDPDKATLLQLFIAVFEE